MNFQNILSEKKQRVNKYKQYASFCVRKGKLQKIHVSAHLYRKDKPENKEIDNLWSRGSWGERDGKGVILLR